MTLVGVYIRIVDSTKPTHQIPHLVPNSLLIQEISYQTYVNGVVSSLQQNKKGLWPPFPLIIPVCKIENFKQAKEEVSVLAYYKFREVSFRRHDPQGKLKEWLQQVGFIWSNSHEDLFLGELSQQQVLVKSRIPTPDQMSKIEKEAETKKTIEEKNRVSSEQKNLIKIEDVEESSSSSSIPMYSIDYDR